MLRTRCLVGNSSSAIREGAFLGTPAVNVGSRQAGRQRATNVVDVGHDRRKIAEAIQHQVGHGPYASEAIYGDGHAGERIAGILNRCEVPIQKRMTY
jgi:UDP-N-acetylglucosamine 2-epimerase